MVTGTGFCGDIKDASNQVDGNGVNFENSEEIMLKSKTPLSGVLETGIDKVNELPVGDADDYVSIDTRIFLTPEELLSSLVSECDNVDRKAHTTSPCNHIVQQDGSRTAEKQVVKIDQLPSKVEKSRGKEALNGSQDLIGPEYAAQLKANKPIVQFKAEDTRRHINKEQNRNKRIKIDGTKKKPKKWPWDIGFWKWLQVMMSFFPATSARKKNICLIFWLLLCPNTSAIEEDRCELKNRSIKMDMDRSTLTFKVCFDEIMCHGNLFRWDKDLKQIFLNPSHEKIGLKYDFHQDLESGCVEMVIKNVTKEDLMAHYEFYFSFQKAEFEPGKQPIIVGEPAIACVNGTLELRSKMKPGLPEINMKLPTFVEKDGQKQETHDMIDVQDGNISVPINGSFTPYNLSVVYYYNTHKYVLLENCIRKKEIEKCKASKTMMQSESDRTGVVIGIACAVLIPVLAALLVILLLWRNRALCFRGRTGRSGLSCKDPSEEKEETGKLMQLS